MSAAAKRRLGLLQGVPPETIKPEWRPFQLAFILMNLPGIAKPTEHDRDVVDLLFFPTGGGKTEAYFGLSAFTLVLRRLRNPGISSAGLSVLMRYTLRLWAVPQPSFAHWNWNGSRMPNDSANGPSKSAFGLARLPPRT
jgi:hypothetical protein